ncbi:MAG: hypothetical protein U0441_17655 [Polyangiaceae bacterium]
MKITLEQRIRAANGPPAYSVRLRRIEDMQAAFVRELRAVYDGALAALGDPERASRRLFTRAALLDIAKLNDLIERHNRYFPTEADLPMDPRTGKVMFGLDPWEPMSPVTVESLVKMAVERR